MKMKRLLRRLVLSLLILLLLTGAFILVFFYYSTPVTQNMDKYIYELPFEKGTRHRVVQGYGGIFSHRYTAAIDFYMPEGTPVCAARPGIIWRYRSDSDEGGIWPSFRNKANYIIIQHDDGSYGCYWHLQKDGVLVKKGRVEAGQIIGLSGATGQVIRPHLHFSVKRVLNYSMDAFVRTRFRTTDGIVFLKNRHIYGRPKD